MLFTRRLTSLRIAILVAILASAVLTADHVRPGREFCPLNEACSAAAESDFGSFAGIPTSVLGLAAFSCLFLLTLLPVTLARRVLQPACFVGSLAAIGLITEQALHLDAFCPLCLVADGAAILLGYLALSWPPLPILRSGRDFSSEAAAARTAWGLGMALTMLIPFAWPREVEPAWEEAPELAEALFEDAVTNAAGLDQAGLEDAAVAPVEPTSDPAGTPGESAAVLAEAQSGDAPEQLLLAAQAIENAEIPATPRVDEPIHASVMAPPAPVRATSPKDPERPPTPPKALPSVRLVEYLNAFCAHCRATHRRLDAVITHDGIAVARRRVYTWSGKGYPLWARACAYAETVGREDVMFRELTRARRESRGEIYAAARRAGLDPQALKQALAQRKVPARLVRDRGIARAARLKRLPTFDIGRRRLSGSQSERELRAARRGPKPRAPPAHG